MVNPPVTGPFTGYPVLSAVNAATPPTGAAVTVNFPAPGSYPFEVDYSECCAGSLVLTMALTTGSTNVGLAPAGSMELTPITIGSQLVGTAQSLQVRLKDASGALLANRPVTLVVGGGHPQEMTAITNASGIATFGYTGTRARVKDTLQARAYISGGVAYSNAVDISWNNGVNAAPTH